MSRRTLSSSLFMVVAAAPLALGACSSSKATTDAPVITIDAPVVVTPDAPVVAGPDALVQAGCSYNETSDSTNGTTVEQSGQTLTADPVTLCGSIATTAPDSSGLIDTDQISFTIATEGDYLFQLSAPTLDSATFADVQVLDSSANVVNSGLYFGNHAVVAVHLTPDTYTVEVDAFGQAAPASIIPYKVVVTTDNQATRCVTITANADYAEANDGVSNAGNDMVDVSFSQTGITETPTAATTDMPEPTGLTLTAGGSKRITGVSGNVAAGSDDYRDRDSFNIAVGAATNQLDIRINWSGSASDFDAFLFPQIGAADTTVQDVGSIINTNQTGPEYGALAVTPSTNFTLWVGVFNDVAGQGTVVPVLPANYDITVCASNYTAP